MHLLIPYELNPCCVVKFCETCANLIRKSNRCLQHQMWLFALIKWVIILLFLVGIYFGLFVSFENEVLKETPKFKADSVSFQRLPRIDWASGIRHSYENFNCKTDKWTSIIVPYRDRAEHLPQFLQAISDHQLFNNAHNVSGFR